MSKQPQHHSASLESPGPEVALADGIIPLYRRVEADAEPKSNDSGYFRSKRRLSIREVINTPPAAHTGLGLRSPVSCRDERGPSQQKPNLHTRMAAGARLPSRLITS